MARRERERYTERNRPHRKEAARGGGSKGSAAAETSPWSNPIVIVAAAALILAVVLAAGFLLGNDSNKEAASPDGEATQVITGTAALEPTTSAVENIEPVTATTAATVPQGTLSLPGSGTPYAAPDDMSLDGKTTAYFAVIDTVSGTIRAELWPELAPATVNSFVFLAREGYFDGLTFHRVEDWVVQGGDPTGMGNGGPGYAVPAEFNEADPVNHRYGTLAMARTDDPNSAGSQFYFIKDPEGAAFLDGKYTVFGHVVEGMDVVSQLPKGAAMNSVTIEEKPISESVVSPDDIRAGDLPETPEAAAKE
jgi:cyclophilin family peptidyl-prolyl cis-trans isomerase